MIEIVGGGHQDHANGGEQHQRVEFALVDMRLADVVDRRENRQTGTPDEEHGEEEREVVEHNAVAKSAFVGAPQQHRFTERQAETDET